MVGSGERRFEEELRRAALAHPGQVGVHIGGNDFLVRKVLAGADLWLSPARDEPDAEGVVSALRYGAVPLVRAVGVLDDAPESASPMEAIATALNAIADVLQDREFSRQRQSVIAANAELRERELIKMASLSVAFADGLRRRGVADPAASLAAEAGVAVFRVAFERWVSEPGDRDLSQLMHESLDQLKALSSAS